MDEKVKAEKESDYLRADPPQSPSSRTDSFLRFLPLIIFGVWVAVFMLWTPVQRGLEIPRNPFTVRNEYWVAGGFLTAWYIASLVVDRLLHQKFRFDKLFLFILVAFILTVLCPVHMSSVAVSQMPRYKPQQVNPE